MKSWNISITSRHGFFRHFKVVHERWINLHHVFSLRKSKPKRSGFLKLVNLMLKYLAIAHRTSNNTRLFFHSHFLVQFSLSRKLKVFGPTRGRASWGGSATQKYTAVLIGSYLRAKIQKPSGVPIREITGICVKLHRMYVIFWSNLRLYDAGEGEGKWNWAREKKSVGRVVYQ